MPSWITSSRSARCSAFQSTTSGDAGPSTAGMLVRPVASAALGCSGRIAS